MKNETMRYERPQVEINELDAESALLQASNVNGNNEPFGTIDGSW